MPISTTDGILSAVRYIYHNKFVAADKNRDGFLSPTESPFQGDAFSKADLNHDGRLSQAEFQTYTQALPSTADYVSGIQWLAERAMNIVDLNGDGYVSTKEVAETFANASYDVQRTEFWAFHASDTNHDQRLSLTELEDRYAWDDAIESDFADPPPFPPPNRAPVKFFL